MLHRLFLNAAALALVLGCLSTPLAAQDRQTLADVRQELTVLYVEVQKLRRELSTTGTASPTAIGGDSVLERMDNIEAELQRLTNKTEELENRVNAVVRDGTNRIGDLEFRLVELEGGDVSNLGETTTLGGGALPDVNAAPAPAPTLPPAQSGTGTGTTPDTGGVELAIGEKADFERASEALAQGDFRGAQEQFAAYLEAYPASPLAGAARIGRGRALEGAGEVTEAARAYLDAFSRAPEGASAPEALFRLGSALGALQQTGEACVTLQEVLSRFPNSPMAAEAASRRASLGCT